MNNQSGGSITTTYKPCDDDPIPKAMTIINNMDTKGIVVHVVLIVMAFITVGIFIDEIYYLRQKCTSTLRRRLTVIQLSIPPVFVISAVTGCFFSCRLYYD